MRTAAVTLFVALVAVNVAFGIGVLDASVPQEAGHKSSRVVDSAHCYAGHGESCPGWNLLHGRGERVFTRREDFSGRFVGEVPPSVFIGLDALDIHNGESQRVGVKVSNRDFDGFDLSFRTWRNAAVESVGASYFAYDRDTTSARGVKLQTGDVAVGEYTDVEGWTLSASQDEKRTYTKYVKFEHAYNVAPVVRVALREVDMGFAMHPSVRARVESVDAHGFELQVVAERGALVNAVIVSWLSHNNVAHLEEVGYPMTSGAFEASEAELPTWPLSQGNGVRTFRHTVKFARAFDAPPQVSVMVRGFEGTANCSTQLRVSAERVTEDGFDVEMQTWKTGSIKGVAVSFVAYDKEFEYVADTKFEACFADDDEAPEEPAVEPVVPVVPVVANTTVAGNGTVTNSTAAAAGNRTEPTAPNTDAPTPTLPNHGAPTSDDDDEADGEVVVETPEGEIVIAEETEEQREHDEEVQEEEREEEVEAEEDGVPVEEEAAAAEEAEEAEEEAAEEKPLQRKCRNTMQHRVEDNLNSFDEEERVRQSNEEERMVEEMAERMREQSCAGVHVKPTHEAHEDVHQTHEGGCSGATGCDGAAPIGADVPKCLTPILPPAPTAVDHTPFLDTLTPNEVMTSETDDGAAVNVGGTGEEE